MEIFLQGQDSDFVNPHVSESSPGNPSHPDPVIPQSENNATSGAYIQLGGSIRYVPQKVDDYLSSNSGLDSHRRRQIVRKGMKS
jgi:hypothetical protein